jgi:uncharacterized membrane protein YeaQ/YmgE (transglycosylase-associated protein family)
MREGIGAGSHTASVTMMRPPRNTEEQGGGQNKRTPWGRRHVHLAKLPQRDKRRTHANHWREYAPSVAEWSQNRGVEGGPRQREDGIVVASSITMTVLEFVVYLVIAGICGAVARGPGGGTGGGFILSILLGFLGAFLGTWIARMLHLPELLIIAVGGHPFPIVWSIIGGFLLVALAHGLMRPRFIA